jgi:O-6-methylguanine DNA methyltransferase
MIVASQIKIREKSPRRALPHHSPLPALPTLPPEALHTHHFALLPTGWGLAGIVWKIPVETPDYFPNGFVERPSDALLSRILTPGLAVSDLLAHLLKRYPDSTEVLGDRRGNFHPEVVPGWFTKLAGGLQAYYTDNVREGVFPGHPFDFTSEWQFWQPHLDWSQLTPFQQAVLRQTAAIPRGEKRTYGHIAKEIGKPSASRAVGAALGANPWPVLIPCHRVIGATGKMTGFSAPGGVSVKRRMLSMEER